MRQNTVFNKIKYGNNWIKKEIEVQLGKRRACIGKSREGRRVKNERGHGVLEMLDCPRRDQ